MKTLSQIIEQACRMHIDIRKATDCAIGLLDANPITKAKEVRCLIERGVRDQVYAWQHKQRTDAKRCPRGIDAISAVAQTAHRSLLAGWILDGTPLGDFTGYELKPFAERARNQAVGYNRNALFFDWLANKAGSDKVSDTVTEDDAAEVWTNIKLTARAEAS